MNQPWKVKCAIDSVKAVLPFQQQLRQFKDRVLGYEREPRKDVKTIHDGLDLIEWLGGELSGAAVLEVGTGWQPMVPILYSLAGARVYMVDLHRLIRQDTFSAALTAIREARDAIATRLHIGLDIVDNAARECRNVEERFRELRLTYLAPVDCRHLPLGAGSIDVVTSRAVLEHIPQEVIADIFRESKRVLRPGGQMLHLVDHSDHWAHRDRSITAVNFLQYQEWSFRLTRMHSQNYQNRLRHSEYLTMLETTGFNLKREQSIVDPTCLAALSKMRVASRFRQFTAEDLATTSSYLLAEPRPSSPVIE